jgi:hypothetical protein
MPISEERIQLLVPRRMKKEISRQARRLGLSVGEYLRRLVAADLRKNADGSAAVDFPFGETPYAPGESGARWTTTVPSNMLRRLFIYTISFIALE